MTQTVHSPSVAPGEDPVDLSWRRSASCGLTPKSARPGAPDPLASRSHRLAEAARPVMDDLDDVLKDTGAMLLLADREGRGIRSVRDSTRIARMLLKRGVDDGATLTEDAVGNNGIGTALETRAGVFIHGEQHFAESLRDFACYGHPIIDPLTRRLVGAVDLTGMSADASRMFDPFVRKIVADIEARYVDTARADDRELWRRFVERTRSSDTATCAFGDEVVLASHSSLERLDSRDLARLRRLAEQDEMGDAVELSVGTVRVLSSRVGRRGHLLDLTFPEQHPTPTPGTSAPPAVATSRSHAVVGPSGSGRTTTATTIAGPDAVHVRLAHADSADAAWRELAVPALRELGTRGGSLVLDDIDLLGDADLRRLAARLGSAGDALVVVTSREDPRPAVTGCWTCAGRGPFCDRCTSAARRAARSSAGWSRTWPPRADSGPRPSLSASRRPSVRWTCPTAWCP
ncbi:GAF domain-containing protein [Dietzia sp. UCD-THP]|uniref:GAF domain-containing protein n=1 Tax=Dietzia sp. UCD-THP TaxID=1292020 RepID=UPI0003A5F27E|nr:GAF domain-containing protein [Dietzia sp. UCD-THP]